jgi:hypothetical protein
VKSLEAIASGLFSCSPVDVVAVRHRRCSLRCAQGVSESESEKGFRNRDRCRTCDKQTVMISRMRSREMTMSHLRHQQWR